MNECKIRPDLLYKLEINQDELENGYPSEGKYVEFVQRFLNEPENTGQDSSMLNFLGLQYLSDKSCADCVEAILGTCVKTIGIERTFKVLEMLEIVPRNGMDITKLLKKKLRSPRIRTDITNDDVDYFLVNHKKLEGLVLFHYFKREKISFVASRRFYHGYFGFFHIKKLINHPIFHSKTAYLHL